MDRNQEGFVLCMLKEVGMVDYPMDRSTFVLAYYNHINACRITDFKNYRSLATQLATAFAGERKQLLLYRLKPNSKHQLIYSGVTDNDTNTILQNLEKGTLFSNEDLFFNSENGAGLLSISVFKINEALKKPLFEQYKGNLEDELAAKIYTLLGTPDGMSYECFGTLGGEDLCVISVSSRFELIYDLVDKLRSMTVHVQDNPQKTRTQTLFQNSYSALVIGDCDNNRTVQWGDARAHIFASVKGNAYEKDRKEFNKYLETINATLDVEGGNYCVGEYDYLWECAAEKISIRLYIRDGIFSRTNSNYQKYLFRTSTVILAQKDSTPAGEGMDVGICLSHDRLDQGKHNAQKLLRKTIGELHKSLDCRKKGNSQQDSQWFGYIDQALSLLCKDYMRVHDMPSCKEWQQELWEQYAAVMEGICFHAKLVRDESSQTERQNTKTEFDADFVFVVSSLHQSFSDISQIDSLYYEKLNSNLHNSGAYVQILRAYYEIIKSIIRIFYAVPREDDIPQDEIIPIVVLGLTPKITAHTFRISEGQEQPKVLVVITLPYQALSNIPKYIGPLIHELFHNFVPTSVRMYNYYYGASLCAVLLREYIFSMLQTLSKLEPFALPDNLDMQVGNSYLNLEKSSLVDVCNDVFLQMHNEIYSLEEEKHPVTFDYYKRIVDEYLLKMAPLGTEGKETVYERFLVAFLRRQEDPLVEDLTDGLKVAYDKWLKDQVIVTEGESPSKDVSDKMFQDKEFIKYIHNLVVEKQSVHLNLTDANGLFWGMWNEIFPDLYDISLLIPEDNKADRLPQYLWQIYSVRNDIDPLADMQYEKDPKIIANDLRIGMVVDILWRQISDEELNEQNLKEYLEQTLDESRPEIGKETLIAWSVYNYRMYRTWLSPLWSISENVEGVISDQLEKLLSVGTTVLVKLTELQSFYKRYYTTYRISDTAKQTQELFGLCLDIIQEYGHPSDYTTVHGERLKTKWVHPSLDTGGGDVDYQRQAQKYIESAGLYEVDNPEDMFKALEDIYAHNEFLKERKLWFRGETDADRKCLPSLMRSSQRLDEPLADIVCREIRYAKAKLYSFVKTSGFNDADWMALLQHYDIPTPILDWSEDFPTSLFFATGRWLTGKKQDKDAAIYTLDPVLMNMAARLMNDKDNKEINIKERIENDKNELNSGHAIGDLPFFSEEMDVRQYSKHASTTSESGDMDLAGDYPIAGRVRMNNDRMVAQAGAFVFPNIHSKITTPPERNQYYDLHMVDALQEKYVELLMENGVKNPVLFLNKIVLSHRHWERFKEFTRHIGMSKDVVYPELSEMRDEINRICQTGLK